MARNNSRVMGFRLHDQHFEKLDSLARQLGTSRNDVVTQLIESAEVKTEVVEIRKIKASANENRNAPTFQGERIAVSA